MAEADQEWLKQQLAAALGWDPAVAEGIVQAIATAESQDEVEQLVQVGGLDLKTSSSYFFKIFSSADLRKRCGLAHQNRLVEALHPINGHLSHLSFQHAPIVSMQTLVKCPAVLDAATGWIRQCTVQK